jgi:hypothetical protein
MHIITMTKQTANASSGTDLASAGSGAPEITSEMLKAGIHVIVEEWVFVAMTLLPI